MSNSIHISNLSVGHNNKTVLKDINWSTDANQMIAVIGRNGHGKSTLLKTLSGLLPEIKGQFIFKNNHVLTLPVKERARLLSIVATAPSEIGSISVKDYIAFGRFPYTNWLGIQSDTDNKEINKAIELCDLAEFAHRNYSELSDGEKQKVNIARAIAQNTPLIVLDEPTVHLDIINKVSIFKLLKKLVDQYGKTVIISTHQIEYALQICDQFWLINNGKMEALSPDEISNGAKLKTIFKGDDIHFDTISRTFRLK